MTQTRKDATARMFGRLMLMASWLAGSAVGYAAEPTKPTPAPAADETVVLGESTLWSQFRVAGPNHVRNEDGSLRRVKIKTSNFDYARVQSVDHRGAWNLTGDWDAAEATPAPAADWAGLAFDDGAWPRERLPQPSSPLWLPPNQSGSLFGSTGTFNQFDTTLLLLRARFTVRDPAQLKACRLSLDYWGGVVVYVNGKEAVRADLPAGQKDPADVVAKDYPVEAFLKPDGYPLPADDDKNKDRLALRNRQLHDFAIPAALLRPGVNVIAIECRAAPFPSQAVQAKGSGADWPPIGILNARLTVAPGTAATGLRPSGIHVWNVMPYDTVTAFDYSDTTRKLEPIVIRAARNSIFSGRLMVSSDQPIKGLTVAVSDLQAKGGSKLPAAAVRVRYAVPATAAKSYAPAYRFDGLLDAIPAEIPVVEASLPKGSFYSLKLDRRALPTAALAPLWFTVKVPRDLPAGEYEGEVRVAAEGLPETKVPLRVNVCAWTMPDPKDFRIQNGLYHAEEVLARHYGVPNYSEQHLELVGKTLALLAEVNSRQIHANLTINFCGRDNPETLVRWIKQPDGSFKHDFTVFDNYLDMVAKAVGTPNTLRLNCWPGARSSSGNGNEAGGYGGTTVSMLDPATGKLDTIPQPPLGTPESYAFWKPVFEEILPRLEKRGWLGQTTLGYNRDAQAAEPAVVEIAHQLWPEGEWTWISHYTFEEARFVGMFKGAENEANAMLAHGFANPGSLETWVKQNPQAGIDPEEIVRMPVRQTYSVKSTPTGKLPPLWALDAPRRNTYCSAVRGAIMANSSLREVRRLVEINTLHRGYDGVGEFGADVFPLKSPTGRYVIPPTAQGAAWGFEGRSTLALLYPGPDGPVATERFEMFREGLELAEAVIFVRSALHKGLLSGELKDRAERYLAPVTGERDRTFAKGDFMPRYMQDMEDAKLLDLAGEVAQTVERK
jgi:hypothetical protein